ncbi:hypothetical protein ACNPNN_12990 [Stenotrophomonas geniculata]|uniref:hypothetical protein n=1 Tax=Stenotrophomonas geniculata TaxID=86188 RepID=UPI003AB0E491
MGLHTATDIARNAQRSFDGLLPPDTEEAFQDACNSLARTYDREGSTAELIAALVTSERALDYLVSEVEVPAHLLHDLRDLLDMQARIVRQIDREMRAGGAA